MFLQELTSHINVSSEQHTNSIKQLLKNISSSPESVKELSRWGLEIGSEILIVGTCHYREKFLITLRLGKTVMQSSSDTFCHVALPGLTREVLLSV